LCYSLEPLGEEQCGEEEQGHQDREDQAHDVWNHRFSTNFWTRPSRAKIATVSTMNISKDMPVSNIYGAPDFGVLIENRPSSER